MPKKILGTGWQFPIALDRGNTIALAQYEEKIRQSILIILSTAKGERVMRPDFGCDIHERVFGVIDASMLTLIRSDVEEALILWEPRIEVLSITLVTEALSEGRIDIQVEYKVRYTNTDYNMVYPFYLESEEKQT